MSDTTTTTSDTVKIEKVTAWILQSGAEADILDAVATLWPSDDAPSLIAAAVMKIAETADAQREWIRAWCLESTRLTYAKMIEIGDFTNALRAIKQIDELSQPLIGNDPLERARGQLQNRKAAI